MSAPINVTWLYVGALYFLAVWLARRRGAELPWRMAAFFYVIVLVDLFRPMTGRYVNIPADIVNIIPPWSGIAHKARISNFEMNDVTMQIVPWAHQVREAWRAGQFPLWNALTGCGYPLLANGQSSALSPLRLLALPLPLGYAMTAEAAMKILIALTFMYLFCRRRYAELPSALGAIAFGFCTFVNTWLHFPLVTVSVWLPAALLACDLLFERRTYERFVFAVAVWSVILIGGHPETASHIAFLCGLYVLWLAFVEHRHVFRDAFRSMLLLALAVFLGAMIASPFLATFAESVTKSIRYQELQAKPNQPGIYSDYFSFIATVQPHFFGHLPFEKPWKTAASAESITGFAGILAIASWFAVLFRTIATRRFRDPEVFFLLATLIVVGIVFNWPVVSPAFHAVFKLAANARLRLFLCFLGALLTAAAVDAAMRERPTWFLAGLIPAAAMLLNFMRDTPFINNVARDTALIAITPSLAVLAVAMLLAFEQRFTVMLLMAMVVAELWTAAYGWNPVLPAEQMYPRTPLIARLQELVAKKGGRTVGFGPALFPNSHAIFGFEDVRAHDPMANGRYFGLLRLNTGMNTADYFAKWEDVDAPLLDYLHVRWAVTGPRHRLDDAGRYREVYAGRDGRIYENLTVLPRFFAARNVILQFKGDRFVHELAEHREWALTAMVNVLPVTGDVMRRDLLAPRSGGAAEPVVSVEEASLTDFRLHVIAPRHCLIVSSVPWWPGWRVTRNGKRIEPQPVNGVFLGFTLPPGASDVRVTYVPATFYVALGFSLTAITLLVWFGARPRRSREPEPAVAE
jgi:hypothetical protein